MTYENQKIALMANALVEYFLSHNAKGLTLSILEDEKQVTILLQISQVNLSDQCIYELKHKLYMERQEEMEEYCWHLLANDSEAEEIGLIGIMVDEATVTSVPPSLTIELIRYL